MTYKTSDGITVLAALEAVRRRPALYIGGEDEHPSPRAQLLELAVTDIALERRPQEVRILLWREGVVTIAYDGRPLPIAPSARRIGLRPRFRSRRCPRASWIHCEQSNRHVSEPNTKPLK